MPDYNVGLVFSKDLDPPTNLIEEWREITAPQLLNP